MKWDARVARAAAVATLVLFVLAVASTAGTDEGGVSLAARLARSLGAAPLCAGVGAWFALGARRGRGELRALATLGMRPRRAALAAALGATLTATLVVGAIAERPSFDATTFFPSQVRGAVRFDGEVFIEEETGIRVSTEGKITRPPVDEGGVPLVRAAAAASRHAVALVLVLASAALALLGAMPHREGRDLAAALSAIGISIVVFHFVGAGRAPLGATLIAPLGLFAWAILRYRQDGWSKTAA